MNDLDLATVNVPLPVALVARLGDEASKRRVNVAQAVRQILEEYFKDDGWR
jgi:hypothetical protein